MLLTSGGVKNSSLHKALVELLGKPISAANALCIPTAAHAQANAPMHVYRFVTGYWQNGMCELGWKTLGVLELTAMPSIPREKWIKDLQETDVLLVNGGDPLYLNYWMVQSGVAELLPTLDHLTYVGLSAGSMIMAPHIGEDFVNWRPPAGGDKTLGLIDFSIFPHLGHPDLPDNNINTARDWAKNLNNPGYAIDDETAFKVVDGKVEVISEGTWELLS